MSDTFDHEGQAYDCMLDDFYWSASSNGEKYLPTSHVCKFCGEDDLSWTRYENGWRLINDNGKLHTCSKHIFTTKTINKGEWGK